MWVNSAEPSEMLLPEHILIVDGPVYIYRKFSGVDKINLLTVKGFFGKEEKSLARSNSWSVDATLHNFWGEVECPQILYWEPAIAYARSCPQPRRFSSVLYVNSEPYPSLSHFPL